MAEFDRYASDYERALHDPIRERFAPGSRFFAHRKWELLRDFHSRHGREMSTSRWLDVGCGLGELLRLGRSSFAQVAGCDPSGEMLRACSDLEVRLQTDVLTLPFEDASFDVITAVCVYHHVEPVSRASLTLEAVRVLRPRGLFCIIEHNPLNPVTQIIVRRTPVDQNAKLLFPSVTKTLMRDAGLINIETQFFLYLPEHIYRKLHRVEHLMRRLPLGGQYAAFGENPAT